MTDLTPAAARERTLRHQAEAEGGYCEWCGTGPVCVICGRSDPDTKGIVMLVLSRKLLERIRIGDDIVITVVDIDRGKIRLGIEAPRGTEIWREEVFDRIQAEKRADTSAA